MMMEPAGRGDGNPAVNDTAVNKGGSFPSHSPLHRRAAAADSAGDGWMVNVYSWWW